MPSGLYNKTCAPGLQPFHENKWKREKLKSWIQGRKGRDVGD